MVADLLRRTVVATVVHHDDMRARAQQRALPRKAVRAVVADHDDGDFRQRGRKRGGVCVGRCGGRSLACLQLISQKCRRRGVAAAG